MMKFIKIKNHPRIYLEYDKKVDKYLTDGVLDLDSKDFKKANKNPLRTFNLWVRVTKVIDGKQKAKKKLFKFDSPTATFKNALDEIKEEPNLLLAKFDEDANRAESEAQAKAEEEKAAQIASENMILNDVWNAFYKSKTTGAGKKWRDSTAKNYKSFYNKWIKDTDLGKTPISEITKTDCMNLIDEIAEEKAIRTATTAIEVLRPMIEWYYEEHEIDKRNPVPSKKNYPFDNVRVIDIDLSEIRKIYEAMENIEDDLYKDIFKWLRTGRRRGEIVGLTAEHIDLKGSSFLVTAETNKAGTDMEYKLRDELRATVRTKKGKLFDVHKDTISSQWKEVIKDIDGTFKLRGKRYPLGELHLHDIRHIISGVLKKAQVPEEIRAKVLGHKRTSITDRYGKHYFEDTDKAFQLFIDIVYGVVPEDKKWGDL